MKILVLYATTEGQTRKIAEVVARQFQGDATTLVDVVDAPDNLTPVQFDAVVIAASIHMQKYQGAITRFVRDHHAELNQMPSVFISVSLSAAGDDPDDLRGVAECVEEFEAETSWTPRQVLQVAGAFRFTKYDFFKSWAMRRIAKDKKIKVNPHEDLELTDWSALTRDMQSFRATLEPRSLHEVT